MGIVFLILEIYQSEGCSMDMAYTIDMCLNPFVYLTPRGQYYKCCYEQQKVRRKMVGFFIGILSGLCMSVQGVFNTQVTKSTGIWVTNIFVQATALLVCIIAWLITDRSSLTAVWRVEPKYMLLGGAIGAVITYTVIKSMELLGPAKAVMIIVVAQLAVAWLIELFGFFGVEKQEFQLSKLIGIVLAIGGIIVFKWK